MPNPSCWSPWLIGLICLVFSFFIHCLAVGVAMNGNRFRPPANGNNLREVAWQIFKNLLDPRYLPKFAKRPGIIILVSSSYVIFSLALIFLIYSIIFYLSEPQNECKWLVADHTQLPNFFFSIFGTIATVAAAVLAFCLVALQYRGTTSMAQIADMIEDELLKISRGQRDREDAQFAIQEIGLVFGLLSDPDSWPRMHKIVRFLWDAKSKVDNKELMDIRSKIKLEGIIAISPPEDLERYIRELVDNMSKDGKRNSLEALKKIDDGGFSGLCERDFKALIKDVETCPDYNGFPDLIIRFHRELIDELKYKQNEPPPAEFGVRNVTLDHSTHIFRERYICIGRFACAYFVLPAENKPSSANRIQGFITNESDFVDFFLEIIRKATVKDAAQTAN